MEEDILMLRRLLLEGRCCSQALIALGLRVRGEENACLEQAASALCLGVHGGLTCGALTGAAMVLALYDPELAASQMIPDLTEWFKEHCDDAYGGSSCDDILAGEPVNRALRCPKLMEDVWRTTRELLEDEGFEVEYHIE